MGIDSQTTSVESLKRVTEHAISFEHLNELMSGWQEHSTKDLAQRRSHIHQNDRSFFAQDVHIHHDSPYGDKPEAMHSRSSLEDAARKRLSIPQIKSLENDLAVFEKHAANNGLEASKVSQFYDAAANIFKSKSAHYNPMQKNALAVELIHHAAHPEAIKQGDMQTCNVSSVEYRLLAREPQAMAKMVAQVAKDGTYVTADGSKLTDNWHSIKPVDGESQRDMLDALVQTTLVNCHWARYQAYDGDPKTYRYERKPGEKDAERIFMYRNGPRVEMRDDHKKIIKEPWLDSEDYLGIYNQVARTHEQPFAIANGNMSRETDITPNKSNDKCTYVNSESELHAVLTKAMADKQFPTVLSVHTANLPFRKQTLSCNPDAVPDNDNFGWHSIAITKYDVATHTVKIHNSWGKEDDVNISLDQLYKATQKPAFWTDGEINRFPK
jgi:hypothetical protein